MTATVESAYALFTSGNQSFSYVAHENTPINNFNRNEVKDVFYDTILGARFNSHLHILRKPAVAAPAAAPAVVAAPVIENVVAVSEPRAALAEPRALSFTENLNGANLVAGKTIGVSGWYVERDPSGCVISWSSNGEPIPGANSNSYTLQEIDIPSKSNPNQRVIRCEAVYKAEKKGSCELLIPGWQAPPQTEAPAPPPIDLMKLEVIGGPYHLDPIKVVATYSDNSYHAGACKWFRKEGRIDDYQPLQGHTEEIYYPTADDLHGNLFVQYTVLTGLKKDMVAKSSVRESFLVIHPDVQAAVESNIKKGSASFDVLDAMGQKRVIYIDKKKVKLSNPASPATDSKVQHSGIVRCELQKDAQSFRLILGPRAKTDPEILRAADRKERDIIALTIRSFIGHTVQNVEQVKAKKLHTTHSLTELGHFVEYVNPAATTTTAAAPASSISEASK